jgi:RHS repeat-associated protein
MNNTDTASREMNGSFSMPGQERATPSNALEIPRITLPAGGGALKSIDEKFQVNAANGTAAFTIPLPCSPNRNGFQPQLSLSYNSGTGNNLFGIGWDIGLPAIQRNTDKKLPRYFDTNDIEEIHTEDLFMFTGQEELVPLMDWKNNTWQVRQQTIDGYTIREYRPRIENGFSRIERIFHPDNGYYWRLTTAQNIVTFFGYSAACRITNPADATQVFKWLPECSFDDKGSWIWYEYKTEDLKNVAEELPEKNRFNGLQPFTHQHLKRIQYGNKTPYYPTALYAIAPPPDTDHFFDVIFDYGEHDPLTPKPDDPGDWLARKDPFSACRAGFELRTYRLCQRVLLFHTFAELNNGMPTLVKSLDFTYIPANTPPPGSDRPTALTYLTGITQKGYIWHNNEYVMKSLPPLTFDYQWLQWNTDVKEVSPESLVHAPTGLAGNFQWVDLYNEGINGILTEQANGWYYKSNWGTDDDGHLVFEQAHSIIPKPSFNSFSNGTLQLQDLDANGQKQIVVHSAATQGYFELGDDGCWQPFRSFLKTLSLDLHDPNVRMLDVNGDGKPEILLSDLGAFWFWENEGKTGYHTPELATKPYDEEKGPAILFSDPEQRIFLADMSGDGLTDLVRIRNGEVCYWANMGYGRFSAKITMDNSPCFDTPEAFNPAYLQLTDISGTGATDLLYLGKNEFQGYLNFNGNAWSEVTTIQPFLPTERPNKITVTDLTGNGTACIVWSSELPAYRGAPMRYIDLMGGKKPHIMCSHANGMGKQTTVVYKSSTHYYLEDKKRGQPWITSLPFPVQVVAQTIVTEAVTNVKYTSQYTYHHGYYDHAEREFRGFGRVEQTDREDFDVFDPANEHHQPPVLTKTWYHTGAFLDRERILTQFNQEYWTVLFKNNGFTTDTIEYALPDAVLTPGPLLTGFSVDQLSAAEWREALRACKGMVLRQEIFGLDAKKRIADEKLAYNYTDNDPALIAFTTAALETEQIPYTVATHNCGIELLQERGNNKYAAFFVKECEGINYVYERQATDPRIAHTLTLTTDDLGNVLESVSVVYPRLQPEPLLQPDPADTPATALAKQQGRAAQQKQWITFTSTSFTKDVIAPAYYYLRKNWQTQTFELTGFTPAAGQTIFSMADFKGIVDSIPEIAYEQSPNNSSPQKRLTANVKTIFYNEDLTAPLAEGLMDVRSIPYESYQLAYTPGLLQDLFVPDAFSFPFVLGDVDLQQAGFIADQANWWIPSGIIQYAEPGEILQNVKDRFFSAISYTDALQSKSTVFYDPYYLLLQRTLDAHQNETRILAFSYRTLSALRMLDVNDNISSVITDELGLLKASAIEGKAGNDPLQGQEADNLNGITAYTGSPESANITAFFALAHTPAPGICDYTQLQTLAHLLLNDATVRVVYDFSQLPCVAARIKREQHAIVNPDSPLQISFEYTDGFGRIAMKKVQAEPGEIQLPGGSLLNTGTQLRWVGTGRTVLNNKGNPIRQYEPYFSTTPAYENDPAWVEKGVSPILYYDGMGRSIKTELPNGTFNRVAFDAWKQCSFDVNDTVKESAWYASRMMLPDPNDPEKIAAIKSAVHDNTPSCVITDTLARPVLSIDHNRWDDGIGNILEEKYFSWASMDISGNTLAITDARGNTVMMWRYDMQSHRVVQTGMDAGTRWTFHNVTNHPVKIWDERFHESSFEYDALHRPTGKRINGGDTVVYQNVLYEKVVYGDHPAMTPAERQAEKLLNRIGQPKNLYDSAGKIISGTFDFKGNLLDRTRIFAASYKNIPNWDIADPDSLLITTADGTFTTLTAYDALNRLVRQTTPDNKITIPGFNPAGLLTTLTLTENGNDSPFITNIDYNEKGQRSSILYGNEVATKYKYDPLTFRLTSLVTTSSSAKKLQDLQYVYDPTGNILLINDAALPDTFFKNALVAAANDYTYDAQYRLINATGREADTIISFGATDNWNDLPFINLHASNDNNALRNYIQRYQYDVVGNIQQMAHSAGAGSWTREYVYENHNNRIHSTAIGNQTWLYPHHAQHGFMTSMPHLPVMQWNFKEELQATSQQVVNNGTPETTYYVYDSTGQRTRKITEYAATGSNTPAKKEERIYLGNYEVYRHANGLVRETLHLFDDKVRVAMLDTETAPAITIGGSQQQAPVARTIRYQLDNQLESVTLELNENAQIINYEEYHPFGTTAFQANNAAINVAAKRYRYTSRERDEETGLEYHTARYYITWLGRWCSADPIGTGAGLNLYRYARNNAVTRSDVNGRADIAVHQYLTILIASQYVGDEEAINIGRASNVSDRKPELDATENSMNFFGHYVKETNIEGHALYNAGTEEKVAHFYNKFKNEAHPTLQGAGENLLHPTQDAHYHKSEFLLGDRLGHLMFPEADLAVRGKSFEDFMAVVHDNEKALELMQDKGVITRGHSRKGKLTEKEWRSVYDGLKKAEDEYEDTFLLLNIGGLVPIVGMIVGTIGALLGTIVGAIVGIFIGGFSDRKMKSYGAGITGSEWIGEAASFGQLAGGGIAALPMVLISLFKSKVVMKAANDDESTVVVKALDDRGLKVKGPLHSSASKDFCPNVSNQLLYTCE